MHGLERLRGTSQDSPTILPTVYSTSVWTLQFWKRMVSRGQSGLGRAIRSLCTGRREPLGLRDGEDAPSTGSRGEGWRVGRTPRAQPPVRNPSEGGVECDESEGGEEREHYSHRMFPSFPPSQQHRVALVCLAAPPAYINPAFLSVCVCVCARACGAPTSLALTVLM